MPLEVAESIARSVQSWAAESTVEVCWHGGEPLATGREHLGQLMDCFAGLNVKHSIQTNATLINDDWCAFFSDRDIHVGVSIDGGESDNTSRVDRKGTPAYGRIVRGIRTLQDYGHECSAIAVVSDPTPQRARRLYDFAVELGVSAVGVNIEETEGVNKAGNSHDSETVTAFWAELLDRWRANPVVEIREIRRAMTYVQAVLADGDRAAVRPWIDPLPTVAYDGTVTLISPEMAGYDQFACGNVLETSLDELIRRGQQADWVQEFLLGVGNCRSSCPYFDFCGGGQASNRYFEEGRFNGTETNYCRNSKIALMEGILRVANNHPRTTDTAGKRRTGNASRFVGAGPRRQVG